MSDEFLAIAACADAGVRSSRDDAEQLVRSGRDACDATDEAVTRWAVLCAGAARGRIPSEADRAEAQAAVSRAQAQLQRTANALGALAKRMSNTIDSLACFWNQIPPMGNA